MTTNLKEPIERDWTLCDAVTSAEPTPATAPGRGADAPPATSATARAVNHRLAAIEVCDLDVALVPYLAAAAAELALAANVSWRFGVDDPPVALLRLIAKVAIAHPDAGGPHTGRLLDQLS